MQETSLGGGGYCVSRVSMKENGRKRRRFCLAREAFAIIFMSLTDKAFQFEQHEKLLQAIEDKNKVNSWFTKAKSEIVEKP